MKRFVLLGVAALTVVGLAGVSCTNDTTAAGTGGSSGTTGGGTSTAGTSSAAGGGSSTGGGGTAGGSVLGCQTSSPPPTALITDFTEISDAGAIQVITQGGTYGYGTPSPTLTEENGSLHVTLNAPSTSSALYLGFGLYFTTCVDGHAYTGVKFDIGGTVTGCSMQFSFNFRDVVNAASDTNHLGACTATSCYGGQANFTVPATPATISIAYSAVAGGQPISGPLTTAAKTFLTGVIWQITVPSGTGSCVVDVTVNNVSFY